MAILLNLVKSARLVRFSQQHICCTDVGGNGSGGYISAAAGRLRHIILHYKCRP